MVRLEPSGRVRLPTAACAALEAHLGSSVEVSGVCHSDAFVVRAAGDGRRLTIDQRGRLYVPAWVRRGGNASLIVGTRHRDRIVVLAAPTVLDRVGDVLIGTSR